MNELLSMTMFGFNIIELIPLAFAFIGVFSVVAKHTPNTTDDKVAQMLCDIVNLFGQNSGMAANNPQLKKRKDMKVVDGGVIVLGIIILFAFLSSHRKSEHIEVVVADNPSQIISTTYDGCNTTTCYEGGGCVSTLLYCPDLYTASDIVPGFAILSDQPVLRMLDVETPNYEERPMTDREGNELWIRKGFRDSREW